MKAIAIIDKSNCWSDCKMIEHKKAINSYICHLNSHIVSAETIEQYCKNMCSLRPLPLKKYGEAIIVMVETIVLVRLQERNNDNK